MSLRSPIATVVIPAHNASGLLPSCLGALNRQEFRSFETVVVDNGSTDRTAELAKSLCPDVNIVALPENRGFAAAANAGVEVARGRYVCLLNTDAVPDPSWLGELLACLERHPRAAAVDCKILRLDDPRTLDGAGDMMTWSLKPYRRGYGDADSDEYSAEREIFSAAGTACAWRAEVFRSLGGFDDEMFAYYEDVDLGFRARLGGHESWYTPRAVVLHAGGATSDSRRASFDYFHTTRNRNLMRVKDAPRWWLVRRAPLIVCGELLSLARASIGGGLRLYVKAQFSSLASLPRWLEKRRDVRPNSIHPEQVAGIVGSALPPLSVSHARRTRFERRVSQRLLTRRERPVS